MLENIFLKYGEATITSIIRIIALIIIAKFSLYFIGAFSKRIYHGLLISKKTFNENRAKTLTLLLQSVLNYIVYFILIIMILKESGFDPMPILAGASVLGFAVGFGMQTLIKDIIAGFFILLEDQFSIGDKITTGNITGIVEEMTLRTTKIRNADGGLLIIPNGSITQVINHRNEKTSAT